MKKNKSTVARTQTPMEIIQKEQEKINEAKKELHRQIITSIAVFTRRTGAYVDRLELSYEDSSYKELPEEFDVNDVDMEIILQEDNG